jgi:hypothetical protein
MHFIISILTQRYGEMILHETGFPGLISHLTLYLLCKKWLGDLKQQPSFIQNHYRASTRILSVNSGSIFFDARLTQKEILSDGNLLLH